MWEAGWGGTYVIGSLDSLDGRRPVRSGTRGALAMSTATEAILGDREDLSYEYYELSSCLG
jgi:hypothetical protein